MYTLQIKTVIENYFRKTCGKTQSLFSNQLTNLDNSNVGESLELLSRPQPLDIEDRPFHNYTSFH